MKNLLKHIRNVFLLLSLIAGTSFAAGNTTDHDKASKGRIGTLVHESVVDGYMLAYYFLDLRDQKSDGLDKAIMDKTNAMTNAEIEKPHHLMVYIMDKKHKPVLKGQVGFLIKDVEGNVQKSMGSYMSLGFGTTADMKKK
ncbi:MAG: hypothetical protein KKE44_17855, partial [Proteobacteria bacterium]|nr:hypothetical protein [Pseudomonadota bacterium]MBU2452472.1 hypothetical protein [Pseudomonadota bacterium]